MTTELDLDMRIYIFIPLGLRYTSRARSSKFGWIKLRTQNLEINNTANQLIMNTKIIFRQSGHYR